MPASLDRIANRYEKSGLGTREKRHQERKTDGPCTGGREKASRQLRELEISLARPPSEQRVVILLVGLYPPGLWHGNCRRARPPISISTFEPYARPKDP
jgi:hypothetical protein